MCRRKVSDPAHSGISNAEGATVVHPGQCLLFVFPFTPLERQTRFFSVGVSRGWLDLGNLFGAKSNKTRKIHTALRQPDALGAKWPCKTHCGLKKLAKNILKFRYLKPNKCHAHCASFLPSHIKHLSVCFQRCVEHQGQHSRKKLCWQDLWTKVERTIAGKCSWRQ